MIFGFVCCWENVSPITRRTLKNWKKEQVLNHDIHLLVHFFPLLGLFLSLHLVISWPSLSFRNYTTLNSVVTSIYVPTINNQKYIQNVARVDIPIPTDVSWKTGDQVDARVRIRIPSQVQVCDFWPARCQLFRGSRDSVTCYFVTRGKKLPICVLAETCRWMSPPKLNMVKKKAYTWVPSKQKLNPIIIAIPGEEQHVLSCSCVRVLWVARAWWRTKMSSRFPWNLVERRPIVEAGSFFNLLLSVWNSLIYAKVAALRRKPTFINRTMIIDVDSHVSALFSLHFHLASCFSITHSIIPVFFSGGVFKLIFKRANDLFVLTFKWNTKTRRLSTYFIGESRIPSPVWQVHLSSFF